MIIIGRLRRIWPLISEVHTGNWNMWCQNAGSWPRLMTSVSLKAPRPRLRSASPDLKARQPYSPGSWPADTCDLGTFSTGGRVPAAATASEASKIMTFLFLTGFEGLQARRQSHKRTRRLLRGGRRIKIVMSEGATESAPYPEVLCVVTTNRAA